MTAIYLGAWLLVMGTVYVTLRRLARRRISRERLRDPARARTPGPRSGWLGGWLVRAGYRSSDAPLVAVGVQAAALAAGATLIVWTLDSRPFEEARRWLEEVPGRAGLLLAPALAILPWMAGALLALLPILHVRSARREVVRQVEEDLPLTLELLATQAQAGLGFDAGLERVLDGANEERPLVYELRGFQRDVVAGVPRHRALRHVAERLRVGSVTAFVTALVHTEQMGGALADALRRMANDVLIRRRERAFAEAQALSARVVVPLVVCFLPGIFVWTLGPAFHELVELVAQVLRGSGEG